MHTHTHIHSHAHNYVQTLPPWNFQPLKCNQKMSHRKLNWLLSHELHSARGGLMAGGALGRVSVMGSQHL